MDAHDGGALHEPLERLREEIERLRASRARLVLEADADRRSLERELHRGVQQKLVVLAVELQLVQDALDTDPVEARRRLGEMRTAVQQALDDAARLAQHIHPPLLEAGGLTAAIRAAAASVGTRAVVEVDATIALPQEVAGTLYRCIVTVLESMPPEGRASVAVRETGGAVGFEIIAERGAATAIEGLTDRVDALGGELTAGPTAGGALRLLGSIPLAR
jgi:signal transduction histidine kinase